MNRHVLRALFQDALYQVLDDKVFRLLVLLSILLVAPTFLMGFKPGGIELLFGWREYSYDDLFRVLGQHAPRSEELNVLAVQTLQEFVVQGLAGTVGLLFCIAATAFFVPRMLEKGAADTLFSKPVGRFALLLARYAAGVLFVACLSGLLVLGMHLGFRIVSGYSDPAFLWSVLTITYVFALVHAVSVTVAVFTRSSIAAILTTLCFFVFTGCIQQNWIQVEHARAVEAEQAARGEADVTGPGRLGWLITIIDGLHWTLPKTTDADFIVTGLRRAVTVGAPVLRDTNGLLSVEVDPPDFVREGAAAIDLGSAPATWVARDDDGTETARLTLSRRDRRETDARGRPRLRSSISAASEELRAAEALAQGAERPTRDSRPSSDSLQFTWVRWGERVGEAELDRRRGFTGLETEMYVVSADFRAGFGPLDDRQATLRRFVQSLRVERKSADNQGAADWYAQTFGWTAPLRHNALVSIGTSLLFALLVLLCARWRLARIDF